MTKEYSSLQQVIAENERRLRAINAPFNPITGQGSVGKRTILRITDFPIREQYIPVTMDSVPLVRLLRQYGSVSRFLASIGRPNPTPEDRLRVVEQFIRVRIRHDFPFWAAFFVYIKNKGGGDDVLFRLTRPQRKFVDCLERFRLAGQPIRIVLLKARQWGGSTTSQIYMAWLQLVHRTGLNSLIIAHQGTGSDEIKDMFDRMITRYPASMLHRLGEAFSDDEPKLVGVGKSGSIHRVPQRNCKIKIGTAERPDSCRGGDYNLVHLSEVGIWKKTDGKTPQDIVRSALHGILYKPYTMIVLESTANGTGNFFQTEYDSAKRGQSQYSPLFISWFDIDQYSIPFDTPAQREEFAARLFAGRHGTSVSSDREESGSYLWSLFLKGATLEAINWYIIERSGCDSHASMASEFPSDDLEAFVNSGSMIFNRQQVQNLRQACRPPHFIGDVTARADEGEEALENIRFHADSQGMLWIWSMPEPNTPDDEEHVTDRYLTVVDIGGRSNKADWSVVVVFDRLYMADGGKPSVVAQWYGHTDIDILAWKAAQIASFYDNSLLVIESNTLETHDRERQVDGDQSSYVLNQIKDCYPNLYARRPSEADIREGRPRRYGFHTNVSTKPMVISTLTKVIRQGQYVERDARCCDEFDTYERKPNGAFGAIIGKHDDLLMTRAIGLHVCFNEMPVPQFVPNRKTKRPSERLRPVTEATF
jgi:hypothetical protein